MKVAGYEVYKFTQTLEIIDTLEVPGTAFIVCSSTTRVLQADALTVCEYSIIFDFINIGIENIRPAKH